MNSVLMNFYFFYYFFKLLSLFSPHNCDLWLTKHGMILTPWYNISKKCTFWHFLSFVTDQTGKGTQCYPILRSYRTPKNDSLVLDSAMINGSNDLSIIPDHNCNRVNWMFFVKAWFANMTSRCKNTPNKSQTTIIVLT